jgi:hypothetical protein
MSTTTYVIRARTVNKLRKEAVAIKKAQNLPHHEALNIEARSVGFNNWEHLQKSAAITAISEEPYKNGFVMAMDIKDAYNHPLSKSSPFVPDDQIYSFVYMDFFAERGYKRQEELTEDDRYFLEDMENNYIYFRHTGQIPKTIGKAFKIAEKEFFFQPGYIWLKGKWYDQFGLFDYDESLVQLKEEMENDPFF